MSIQFLFLSRDVILLLGWGGVSHRWKTWSLPWCGHRLNRLHMRWKSLLLGRRGESGSGCNRRVLRRLGTRFGILTIAVDIHIFRRSIESHATELYSRSIQCMLSRHNNSFLLLQNFALKTRCTASCTRGFPSTCSISTHRRSSPRLILLRPSKWCPNIANIHSARSRASCCDTCDWYRCIWNLLEVCLCQFVIGRWDICRCQIGYWRCIWNLRCFI